MTVIIEDKPKEKSSFVDKVKRKPYPPLEERPQLATWDHEIYEAITEARGAQRITRFKVIMCDGVSYGCSYAQLLNWIYTPPEGLQIITSSFQFNIEGTGLEKLDAALMNDKVISIRAFNSKLHQQPEVGTPLITSIEIQQPEFHKPHYQEAASNSFSSESATSESPW